MLQRRWPKSLNGTLSEEGKGLDALENEKSRNPMVNINLEEYDAMDQAAWWRETGIELYKIVTGTQNIKL